MDNSQADRPSPALPMLDRALALVEFLRAHCPWDAEQTPRSLRRHLLDEAHEVVDAIERSDEADLRDELGDLLLNLAFQIVLAEERGAFDRAAVVGDLEEKMRRRHPHLYGLGEAEPWERIKAREREARGGRRGESRAPGLLADVPAEANLLKRAQRLQTRAAQVGFDWPDAGGALEKMIEEVEEVGAEYRAGNLNALEEEVGDLLFSVVNFTRLAGVDAPLALARANAKFVRRFERLEALASERSIDVSTAGLEALDRLWDEAKGEEA